MLRLFFTQDIATKTGNASESTGYTDRDVKLALSEIIRAEDKTKPFSDQKLSEKLQERGFTISRRTISKYREAEHIPDARSRKCYENE